MTIDHIQISNAIPVISGQMGHIVYALEALRQDAKAPPLNRLKAGQQTGASPTVCVTEAMRGVSFHRAVRSTVSEGNSARYSASVDIRWVNLN